MSDPQAARQLGTMFGYPTCFCKAFTMSASVTSPISWIYLWQNSRNTSINAASNSWFVYLPSA